MEESTKKQIQLWVLFIVCAISWYLSLRVRGRISPLDATVGEHFAGITFAITIGVFVTIAFEKWIWRWRILHPWLVDTPLVAGSWKGKVLRKYSNGATHQVERSVIVKIDQPNISKILFVQTREDKKEEGYTEACQLYKAADGKYYLEGIYQLTKNEEHEDTNGKKSIYYGAMRLELDQDKYPSKLTGSYWSDSPTCGCVELSRVDPR